MSSEHIATGPSSGDGLLGRLDALLQFQGTPQEYVVELLKLQCSVSDAVEAGAVIRIAPDGQPQVLALHPQPPPSSPAPPWLAAALQGVTQAAAAPDSTLRPLRSNDDLYGAPARQHLLCIPLRASGLTAVAAFALKPGNAQTLEAARASLELAVGYLSLYEMRLALGQRQADFQRLHAAMGVLASVSEHERFVAVAMALCNEIASRWSCERVNLGFLKQRCVALRAMSHTEKFSRKMAVVQDIEATMEECFDQDTEILHPADPEARYVSRAAAELSRRHGPFAVLSLPLRKGGEVQAVLTLERAADQPFAEDEIEAIRLTADLCTPLLMNLHEHDRWVGARLAGAVRRGFAALVGPKHTWIKVAAILVFAAGVFFAFARGNYTVDAPFVLEPVERRVVPAPFDGILKEVTDWGRIGRQVEGGKTVLARLDVGELKGEVARLTARRLTHEKEAAKAMRDDKRVEAQIARARADEVSAQITLLQDRIARAEIVAPISGTVVRGDLERHVDSPVKTGEVLFEIAPIQMLRAELAVPQDRIADVVAAQVEREAEGGPLAGTLASASEPRVRFRFTVTRLNPLAEVTGQQNVFKARAVLAPTPEQARYAASLRPGMEGLAKIHIGRRRLIWIWTRGMIDWVRMKLWL